MPILAPITNQRRPGTPSTPSAQLQLHMSLELTNSRVANADNELFKGQSPWAEGVTFTVSGYAYRALVGKENEQALPALETSLGYLFVSTLSKPKVDAEGNRIVPNGAFNRDWLAIDKKDKTNKQVLTALVDLTQGKTLVCHRRDYVAADAKGRRFPASFVEFDYQQ